MASSMDSIAGKLVEEEMEYLIGKKGVLLDLPVFYGDSWQDAVSEYSVLEQEIGVRQLKKGAVLDRLSVIHGAGTIEEFARETGEHPTTLYDYRNVYRKLKGLGITDRSEILSGVSDGDLFYSYLLKAVALPDDRFIWVLREARDKGWKKQRIAEEVARLRGNLPSPERPRDADAGYPLLDGMTEEQRDRLAEKYLDLEARGALPPEPRESVLRASEPGPTYATSSAPEADTEQNTCPTCNGKGIVLVTDVVR